MYKTNCAQMALGIAAYILYNVYGYASLFMKTFRFFDIFI